MKVKNGERRLTRTGPRATRFLPISARMSTWGNILYHNALVTPQSRCDHKKHTPGICSLSKEN